VETILIILFISYLDLQMRRRFQRFRATMHTAQESKQDDPPSRPIHPQDTCSPVVILQSEMLLKFRFATRKGSCVVILKFVCLEYSISCCVQYILESYFIWHRQYTTQQLEAQKQGILSNFSSKFTCRYTPQNTTTIFESI
jgi:hypothetical protein